MVISITINKDSIKYVVLYVHRQDHIKNLYKVQKDLTLKLGNKLGTVNYVTGTIANWESSMQPRY